VPLCDRKGRPFKVGQKVVLHINRSIEAEITAVHNSEGLVIQRGDDQVLQIANIIIRPNDIICPQTNPASPVFDGMWIVEDPDNPIVPAKKEG
jgi:hypothetical protein